MVLVSCQAFVAIKAFLDGVQGKDELKAPWQLRWPSLLLRGARAVGGILGLWDDWSNMPEYEKGFPPTNSSMSYCSDKGD